MIIQTRDCADRYQEATGVQSKRLDGSPGPAPTPKPGHTIRTVGTIAPRPVTGGTLKWDSIVGELVWLPDAPGPVPTLTARQLRLWLIGAGMTLESIEAQIAAIGDPAAEARARVEWEYATVYHHDHPLVLQIGSAMGLDQAKIDAAFRAAASL